MRLERLTNNKIKIFLTIDDLSDRGLTKEDIWKDSLKWHQLFHDMLEEASEEFDLEIIGSVAVEIFSLHAQGMVMIVTMIEQDEDEEQFDDGIIEMQVTVDGSEDILFEFNDIEDVIQLAKRLLDAGIIGGSLHSMNDHYYLLMNGILPDEVNMTVSLMAEYGVPSILSIHRLLEYGNEIMEERAVENLVHYFIK
ncbi:MULTISPECIES: genetic competence negative regulator [Mesobacillus]|uniref:Adapter protein MecA n=1 Tax=Mesobacillus selenatarsenatis TaxID=388741 RepID=A0A846TR69_9BACI|nr:MULTISPECIES: genetic competence negative regulator [Mesobacillus]NKE04911.1 genetic competence negative regulator [Mesobacillus selenatarsenatis]